MRQRVRIALSGAALVLVAVVAGFGSLGIQPIDGKQEGRGVSDLHARNLLAGGGYPSTYEGLEALPRQLRDGKPVTHLVPDGGWGSAFVCVSPNRTDAERFFLPPPDPDRRQGAPHGLSHGSSASPNDESLATDGVARVDATMVDVAARCVSEAVMTPDCQTCVVPAFRKGKLHRMKVFCAKPGRLLHRLGFRDADVITSVAGLSLATATPDSLTELSSRLPPRVERDLERIDFDLERGGEPMRLTIRLRVVASRCRAFW